MGKKVFIAVAIVACAATAVFVAAPFCIRVAVERSLRATFHKSAVTIGSSRMQGIHGFALRGIAVSREPWYRFQVKEVSVVFTLRGLMQGRIARCLVQGVQVEVSAPKTPVTGMGAFVSLSTAGPAVALGSLEVKDAQFSVRAKDLQVSGSVSGLADLSAGMVKTVEVALRSFEGWGLFFKDVRLNAAIGSIGAISFSEGRVQKAALHDCAGEVVLRGGSIEVPKVSLRVLDGVINGKGMFSWKGTPAYSMNMQVSTISLAAVTRDFELAEKFTMQGGLSGEVRVQGVFPGYPDISGGLVADQPGGTLVITDAQTIKAIAGNQGITMETAMESFKNYQYDKGDIRIFLEAGDIVGKIDLDGTQGKRSFTVTYHLVEEQGRKK